MTRWKTLLLATFLGIASSVLAAEIPQAQDTSEAAEEARERQVMQRFLMVLEKAPRRGTALDRVYGYHVERGSLDAFIKTYRDKVLADSNDGASWLLIGLVEAQRGRDSAAVEALRKAESVRTDDPLPSYYLGQALVLVGQPDAAAEAFERALTRKPSRADLLDVYQALGRVHQRAHRNDKALAVWDRLEKAFPDDPRVQEQIAHALADESQDAAALTRFEVLAKATKKDPSRRVQFAIEAAELKVRLGRAPEALADFEGLLGQLDAESWLGREVRHKVEEVFLRTDDLAGLAAYYESWIKKTPDDIEARARLGRALASQGRVAEARKWLDEAVKLAPSRRELRLALIEQLGQERKFAEAAGQYEALAKLEPNNPDVVRDWGRMLLRDVSRPEPDRKRAAAEVWRRLAPDDTRDAVAVAQAADLLRQAGLADEAISLYLRAIKLAPDSAQYREYLGEYYHALNRPADALATWRASAEGKSKNAKTLGRLGEVLAGFGYRNEAVSPLTEAIQLEPDDFDLRLKLADLKLALDRPLEALPELEKAEKVASAEEQTEAVLERLIHAYQASGTVAARVEALEKSLATSPTAAGWTRLARLLEAEQKSTEAARAIGEATRLDPKSIPAWVATARLREAAGQLLGSADALRTLTKLDRRSRTDYLTGIAKLEARLGRRVPALEAGRELLAAAPGNPENHQFFAELCFQLGEPDEGLDALRRSARANPADPKATLTLAENLARQFRAEEAIELFWRAFARTTDLDGKLSIVGRMADQYLQRNQLDRLIGRLERELREPNQRRELSLCLAQAHASAGDFGTARLELERLLATDARDAALLTQLSSLAEQEGDTSTAAKYQKQAVDVAPSAEGTARLAQLYLRAGEYGEAESIWTRTTEGDQDPGRALSAIDSLMAAGKRDAVLLIAGRLLRTRPDDWELLYREGVALAGLNRSAEADARFRAILALKLVDDEKGLLGRSKGGSNATGRPGGSMVRLPSLPVRERVVAPQRLRFVVGLDAGNSGQFAFVPLDFGQVRLAAIAWRLSLASRENRPEDFLKECQEAKEKSPGDARPAWDWYYLQTVRMEPKEIFEAAKNLAKRLPADPAAQWALLNSLTNRTLGANQQQVYRQPGSNAPDPTPALPPEEVDLVLSCYESFQNRRADLSPSVLADVLAELKRANRKEDADRIYRLAMASMVPGSPSASLLGNVAAERGDFDGLLAHIEKLERSPGSPGSNPVGTTSPAATLAELYSRTIALRGVARAYPDVLTVLDRALAAGTRARTSTLAATRPSASLSAGIRNSRDVVTFWINGMVSQARNLEFPPPNARHDLAALGVIRTAFEVFRRDDLLTDLFAHLEARAERLAGLERADVLLALGYCRWWNDDKDEAEQAVARAAEVAGSDPSIRLVLAELFERRGSMSEALATIDSVDAIDSSTVLRREIQALRLAVATGNVDRARTAAERLFGLRLDSDTQVQLAALMNQLGMHELAEAVLARARKAAGSKPPSLLILMQQYQRQQKTDQALQVALQILRLRPLSGASLGQVPQSRVTATFGLAGAASGMMPVAANNTATQDEYARTQAIQTLSKSGKLNDLVNRAEAQLVRSPNSMQVLQTLAEYARVANDKEKARSFYDRMARTRPDDARLRAQLGFQLFQGGDPAGALDHFRAAIKLDPSVLASQFNAIINVYRQANKFEEFAALMEGVDLRAIGNTNIVSAIAQNLMNDAQLKERGLELFRRIWATFPLERANYINLLADNDDWWRLPESYAYARDVVLPAPNASVVKPWSGVDVVQRYENDGRLTTLANRLLDAANRQNKGAELEGDVRRAIEKHPNWAGGKVLLALLALQDGRIDDTRALVRSLMAEAREPMPSLVRWLMGQALEENSRLETLAEELYEAAVREFLAKPVFDPNNPDPSNRLLARYKASSRLEEGRELVLKLARAKRTSTVYDPSFVEAQRIFQATNYAQQLLELGYSGDAVGLYREQIAASLAMEKDPQASQYINVEGMVQQARQSIQQALRTSKAETQRAMVASLLRPASEKPKPGEAVDLYLTLPQLGFEKDRVSGGIVEVFRKLADSGGTPVEAASGLASLLEQSPDDFTVNIAAALLAFAEGKRPAIEASTSRLLALAERSPLEVIPSRPGRSTPRPNSRQRADAGRRLGLWLVARECWTRGGMKPLGDRFAAQALEAARRHADPRWPQAMLRREWGQVEIDLGDREQAARRWSELLDMVLAHPDSKKSAAKDGRPEPVPATPREQFDKAILLARMAAERGLMPLSTRAVREAFRGGSPVGAQLGIDASNLAIGGQPQAFTATRVVNRLVRAPRVNTGWDDGSGDATTAPIMVRISELERLWALEGVEPRLRYEVLRDVALPVGRANDVDLYPLGLGFATAKHPRSLGDLLASLAVRVGAADELREAASARHGSPVSELSSLVLQAQIDLASDRPGAVSATLRAIEVRLAKDSLKASAELAAHAALAALEVPEAEESAVLVLERVVRNIASQTGVEPTVTILQALGGRDLDMGRLDSARKRYRDYFEFQDKAFAVNQGNAEVQNFYRRGLLLRIAAAFARRGLVPDSLEMLGRYADIAPTRYQESSPNGTIAALARGLAKLPPAERYRLLKEWTLPSMDRKAVRSLVAFLSDSNIPPAVFGATNVIPPGGVVATPLLLIEAAKEAGKLDELASEVRVLDRKTIDDARPFMALIEIARGKGVDILAMIDGLAEEHEKVIEAIDKAGGLDRPMGVSQPNAPRAPTLRESGTLPNPPLLTALVASACLRNERLAASGARLAEALIRRPWNGLANGATATTLMLVHLRRDVLRSKASLAAGREHSISSDAGLGSWISLESATVNPLLRAVPTGWFEHGGHVGLQGPNPTIPAEFAFAFPLAGSFEFSSDTQALPSEGEAAVAYGGQTFGTTNSMNNNGQGTLATAFGASRAFRAEGFNRVTIKVESGKVRAQVNGLVVAEDPDPDPTFPWLALSGKGRASWRNFQLAGRPEVPREVPLSLADRLGGWQGTAYAENLAPRARDPEFGPDQINLDAFDWSSRDGEIRGRRMDESATAIDLQSRLAYARPLLDGESVSYSFLYEPGLVEVHPALGRLAFLIEPDGVRLHWLTDGPGLDPSGLPADNVVDEPSSRRGPTPTPLKPNAWNQARLSLRGGKVAIELNGQLVFERPIAPTDDRIFGLFHFKDRTASKVRDVVLRGDWPEKFEATRGSELLAKTRPSDEAEGRAGHALIGEGVLTRDADLVLARTRSLPPSERYKALAAWVPPGSEHSTFRLQGVFTPLDPAPIEGKEEARIPSLRGRSRVELGGEPESPAADLVEVARLTGKLDELAGRVESARTGSSLDERGRFALLAMVRLAQGRDDEAIAAFERLKGLAGTIKPSDPDWMRWPELTAACSALTSPKAVVRASALAVLVIPSAGTDQALWASDLFVRQVRQARAIGESEGRGPAKGDDQAWSFWAPATASRASERGLGYSRSSWSSSGGVWTHQSGRAGDALFFRVPIRGDFEASAELSAEVGREANLAYAGVAIRLKGDRKGISVRQDGQGPRDVNLSPSLEIKGDWVRWKLQVREGRMVVSIEGRTVFERSIPADAPPWLAIESPGALGGSARRFALVGKPIVPDRVRLSNLADLAGWWSGEYPSMAADDGLDWRKRGDEILGRSSSSDSRDASNNMFFNQNRFAFNFGNGQQSPPSVVGSKLESVLRSTRPMLEDGEVEYEFYHEPGKATVHPALGRLAFVINPDGVSLHRLSDGAQERTGLEPGNLSVEPSRRRGPPSPPLRPKGWNRLKLAIAGDVATITLNDVVVYERPIETTNSRTFGLFHFADEGEARVREVSYRGDWPRAIPTAQ
jgi:tetratricopeptide (TPR) repeat protein